MQTLNYNSTFFQLDDREASRSSLVSIKLSSSFVLHFRPNKKRFTFLSNSSNFWHGISLTLIAPIKCVIRVVLLNKNLLFVVVVLQVPIFAAMCICLHARCSGPIHHTSSLTSERFILNINHNIIQIHNSVL
jgi:hypothetical protein